MINISKTMQILGKKYPRSTTTLNSMRGRASPFEILISCLLSLRARNEMTRKVKLFGDASLAGRLSHGGWWDASLVRTCTTGGNFYE